MRSWFEALDESHKNHVNLVDEATIETSGDYLEEPFQLYSEAQVTYSQVCNKREKAKALGGFKAAKGKAIVRMQAFKGSCEVLIKLSSDKSISFNNLREELAKIEVQYEKLRVEKADIDPGFHLKISLS